MSRPFRRLRQFFAELKRRNVYKVAVTYAVVAFVTLQAAKLIFPATTLEGLYDKLVVLAFVGFPISLVLAWAFEMTPEGMRRTETIEGEGAGESSYQWIGLVSVVVLAGGVWYATTGDEGGRTSETPAVSDTTPAEAAPSSRAASRDRPFVAVLPLENLSPSEENAFFADGIHEEVLGQLSKVSGLGVFGRTTMRQYADTDRTLYEIGRELDAQAVLEGSVRRAAGRVRISAQLIDPDSRDHLWSETYERELSPDAIFDIQADIAGRIAAALEARLRPGERERIAEAPTQNLAAYDAYLRGRDEWIRISATGNFVHLDRSVEHLREAVRRDSTFGEAHAMLGSAVSSRYEITGQSRWLDSASAAIERGRKLAPNSSAVHVARTRFLKSRDSLDAAERTARRGLELHPSHVMLTIELSKVFKWKEEWAEAIRWLHRVVQLDPRVVTSQKDLGQVFTAIGMLDIAEAWLQRSRDLAPEPWYPLGPLARLQLARGQIRAARETVAAFRADNPDHGRALSLAAEVALYSGEPKQAKAYMERVPEALRRSLPEGSPTVPERMRLHPRERALLGWAELRLGNRERGRELLMDVADTHRAAVEEGEPVSHAAQRRAHLAAALAALGETEGALRQLERLAKRGYPRAEWLRTYPLFEPIRSEARFQEIVGRVEANQREYQEKVRQLDLDLYPPGAEPDTVTHETQTGD